MSEPVHSEAIFVGDWEFVPSTGMLSKEGISHRLEHRAASLLELLCRGRGHVVSHAEIIERVWDGRSISPNSVAVVIADIRRALGDNARHPDYIETLPKRGYRIMASLSDPIPDESDISRWEKPASVFHAVSAKQKEKNSENRSVMWPVFLIGSVFFIFAVIIFTKTSMNKTVSGPVTQISLSAITNHTEDDSYSPLATALSDLLETELMRTDRYQITLSEDATIAMGGRVILWEGHAALSLRAKSTETDTVIWSGMASGPEANLPAQLRAEVRELTEALDKQNPSKE